MARGSACTHSCRRGAQSAGGWGGALGEVVLYPEVVRVRSGTGMWLVRHR